MTGPRSLQGFLGAEPLDAGCAETFALIERYAERVLAGDAEWVYPAVTAHLRSCAPCEEDLRGLLALLGERLPDSDR
jgi:hypothetical protein